MNYLNIYYCEDCDEEWEDEWSCMCNDKCPECGKEYEPVTSVVLREDSVYNEGAQAMIKDHHIENFKTLELAFRNRDLALLECKDAKTGETVIAVCAMRQVEGEHLVIPLAKLFNGNPYEELVPPWPNGETE